MCSQDGNKVKEMALLFKLGAEHAQNVDSGAGGSAACAPNQDAEQQQAECAIRAPAMPVVHAVQQQQCQRNRGKRLRVRLLHAWV